MERRRVNSKLLDKLDAFQVKLQSLINFFQFKYYRKISRKLSDSSCIPPLIHDNKFITKFKEKSKIFNSFFTKQCSLIDNGSTLPPLFPLITERSLLDVDFSVEDIKNISKLDSNKAHGDDMISIGMFKLCDNSICKPLSTIFKSCLTLDIFSSEWEEGNVVPIHKKTTSNVLKTADLSLFSQSVAKFKNVLFTTRCSHILS